MASLGRCKDCHYEPLSDSAQFCPNCGSTKGPEFRKISTTPNEVRCSYCNGSGKRGGSASAKDRYDNCPGCNGLGTVTKGLIEYWE